MANDINKIIIIGRLTRDPEMKHTPNGTAVANFSIANNRNYTVGDEKREEVGFYNCVAWSKLAELIVQYCPKGSKIALEGRLQQRRWETDQGQQRSVVEIVAENVQFLSTRQEKEQNTQTNSEDNPFSDDDIPF